MPVEGAILINQPKVEVYLPWKGFNKNIKSEHIELDSPKEWAFDMAKEFHPNWYACKWGAKALHARNTHQVLGAATEGPKSDIIICWTKDGKGQGGTGQALRIANNFNIPIYDLGNPLTGRLFLDIIRSI